MRRIRESTAKGHTTPPIIVREVDPFDEHPSLGPIMEAKRRRAARIAVGRAKSKTKVKVDVEVNDGSQKS